MADSTSRNESITEALPKALGKYLLDNVEGLKEYYDEFPEANQVIKLPSVSVFCTNNEFRPMQPYIVKKPQDVEISAHKFLYRYVTGIFDIGIQVDLWAGSKEERDDVFDSIFNALNPRISPMGLVLKLEEYFNQLCDIVYVEHTYADSEERSQKDEWRVTLRLLATVKSIRERRENVIEEVEINTDVIPIDQEP